MICGPSRAVDVSRLSDTGDGGLEKCLRLANLKGLPGLEETPSRFPRYENGTVSSTPRTTQTA